MTDGLTVLAAAAALLGGMAWGVRLEAGARRRAEAGKRLRRAPPPAGALRAGTACGERTARGPSASKLLASGILLVDASATYFVLYLCWLSITSQFTGSLPYLTALIGAMQAATGYVLGHYFKKSTAENTAGGITYDAALGTAAHSDAADIFDTV